MANRLFAWILVVGIVLGSLNPMSTAFAAAQEATLEVIFPGETNWTAKVNYKGVDTFMDLNPISEEPATPSLRVVREGFPADHPHWVLSWNSQSIDIGEAFRKPSGAGNTANFAPGEYVVGVTITFSDGRVGTNPSGGCLLDNSPLSGKVFEGVVNGFIGEIQKPPCQFSAAPSAPVPSQPVASSGCSGARRESGKGQSLRFEAGQCWVAHSARFESGRVVTSDNGCFEPNAPEGGFFTDGAIFPYAGETAGKPNCPR